MPLQVQSWKVIAGALIIMGGLCAAAKYGATSWHTPVVFGLGVLAPAFGFKSSSAE